MLPGLAPPPDLAAFRRLAQASYVALPDFVRARSADVVIAVAEEADPEVLADLGIEDPLELTGLYDGVALTERSVSDVPGLPDTVWLYRRAILEEWRDRAVVPLQDLVAHVLVHEIAHHFGFSDAEIAEIDQWWL